jgi:hypothetical protein
VQHVVHSHHEEAIMRRILVLSLALMALLGFVAPPDAFAQAAAPQPKFTITGLIDNLATYSRNVSNADGIFNRKDNQFYGRTRGRFDIIGEVGQAKAVFGFELDEVYGQTGSANSTIQTNPGAASNTVVSTQFGTDGSFSLNTDNRGQLEIKWLYVEFPLPLVPFSSIVRLGAQPFATAASYKLATYANGDFAGVNLYSTFSPTFKLQTTYVAVEENLVGTGTKNGFAGPLGYTGSTANSQNRGDDWAVILSPEFTPLKGLDIKPMFSWFHAAGTTSASARAGRGGINTSTAYTNPDGTSHGGVNEDRLTVGVDARYRMGPFSFDPSILYQFGSRDVFAPANFAASGAVPGRKYDANLNAWLIDLRAGFQLGPLLLEGLGVYSTGNTARNNTLGTVRYFQPLDTDTGYLADWGTQLTSLGVDYLNAMNEGATRVTYSGNHIGWDKYGRIQLGAKATYALTPALSLMAGVNGHWTAEKVDRNSTALAGAGLLPVFAGPTPRDSSRYVGTEFMSVLSWRFAPGLSWDNAVGYMIMGRALDAITDPTAGPRNTTDVSIVTSRVRLSF